MELAGTPCSSEGVTRKRPAEDVLVPIGKTLLEHGGLGMNMSDEQQTTKHTPKKTVVGGDFDADDYRSLLEAMSLIPATVELEQEERERRLRRFGNFFQECYPSGLPAGWNRSPPAYRL